MATKEELLKKVGTFGRFQKRSLFAIYATSLFCSGIIVICSVFVVYTPPHRCYIAELDDNSTNQQLPPVTEKQIINSSADEISIAQYIPMEIGPDGNPRWSQCQRYKNPIIDLNSTSESPQVINCQDGWRYFSDHGEFTAVMEFNLVCDQAWLAPLTSSVVMLGFILGAIGGSFVADRYGRRSTLVLVSLATVISTLCTTLMPIWKLTYVSWCILGITSVTRAAVAIIMINELTPEKYRYTACFINMLCYACGIMVIPLLNYLLPVWRHLLGLLSALQLLTSILVICFVSESLTWLLQNSKKKQAIALIRHIGEVNKRTLDDSDCLLLEDDENKQLETQETTQKKPTKRRMSYVDLLKVSFLRRRIFILAVAWTSVTLSYYGLSINTNNLGGDRYVACFFSAVVEIPGNILCLLGLKKIGGRITYLILTGLTGICLLITPVLLHVSSTAVIVSNMVGKLFSTGAFSILYVFMGDFFPTLLRNQSYGASSLPSRIATMLVPYLLYLGENYQEAIPYIVMGIVAVIASIGMYFLPETRKTSLPETMEDAKKQNENLMKCFWSEKKQTDKNHNDTVV